MLTKIGNLVRSSSGQGMTEYIIIVAIIAIACIVTFALFGEQIMEVVKSIGSGLSGQNSTTTKTGITPAKKKMSDFATGQ